MHCNTITTFKVPTKVEDNCSYSAETMQQILGQEEQDESKAKFDAFQYYSNDLLRLKTLLDSSDGDDADELNALAAVRDALRSAGLSLSNLFANRVGKDSSKRRRGNNSEPITIELKESETPRKTRLSWEVHPSLLLHDLYDEFGEDIHVQSVSDCEEDYEE